MKMKMVLLQKKQSRGDVQSSISHGFVVVEQKVADLKTLSSRALKEQAGEIEIVSVSETVVVNEVKGMTGIGKVEAGSNKIRNG